MVVFKSAGMTSQEVADMIRELSRPDGVIQCDKRDLVKIHHVAGAALGVIICSISATLLIGLPTWELAFGESLAAILTVVGSFALSR